MIARYTRRNGVAMRWSEEEKYNNWLRVEIEALHVRYSRGEISKEELGEIHQRLDINIDRIHELEKETRHDVLAFVRHLEEQVGEAGRWIHHGLTSSDVVDTALGLTFKRVNMDLAHGLNKLRSAIALKQAAHNNAPMVGRTHGIHAEVMTFGTKMNQWAAEVDRNITRFREAAKEVEVGKISGAVGAYGHVDAEFEHKVLDFLRLQRATSTQVVPRDRHAHYMNTLSLIAGMLERFATEIRHLSRTEVGEVAEAFAAGQQGSSTMPHKRNPITSEQICGMARVMRGYAMMAQENMNLWHERDISHSSVERIIFPDATILLDYMLHKFTDLVEGLVVNEQRMVENLHLTGGAIHAQALLLHLVEKGMGRQEAYEITQNLSMRAMDEDTHLVSVTLRNDRVLEFTTRREIRALMKIRRGQDGE